MEFESRQTRDDRIISYWLRKCDEKSGQNYLNPASIADYAHFLADSTAHFCFVNKGAFCGFTVEEWPYKFRMATPFCLVSDSFEGLISIMNAVEGEGKKLGVERWRLQAKDERLAKLLKRRYRHTVEGCAILLTEGRV